jgi:hypothetical protein
VNIVFHVSTPSTRRSLLGALVVLLALGGGATRVAAGTPPQVRQGALIDMPYFAQTPLLCGGAALAMVLRYWGATAVVPDDFRSLIDQAAGGITTSRLAGAARARGWQVFAASAPASSPIDALAAHVGHGRPVVALIQERPGVDHYVVVVGVTASDVVVHDPAREPYRVLPREDFDRRWQTSARWMLLVLPGEDSPRATVPTAGAGAATGVTEAARTAVDLPAGTASLTGNESVTPCDALVTQGVVTARADHATAERVLRSAVALCPERAGGYRELAGLRFVQQRWGESITFAEQAVAREPGDRHAWQLLATSRFLDGEPIAALRAWNAIDELTVDTISVDGLRRTPQPVVTAQAGLRPGQRLTADGFTRATRRLEEFPSASRSSLTYTPVPGGRASVATVVNERRILPSGLVGWGGVAVDAAITKKIRVDIAAPFAQGELWQPSFRWPRERRRVALDVSLPVPNGWPGLIHVETFWERQTYARQFTETGTSEEIRRRIGASYSDWMADKIRVEFGVAADRLDNQRYVALAAGVTSRLWRDHFATHVRIEHWLPPGDDRPGHSTIDAAIDWRSTTQAEGPRWTTRVGAAVASTEAPLALWPGAGSSDRSALLRGRRLVSQHVLSGEVFGRRVAFASAEHQRPVWRSPRGTVAVAGFVDAAKAWDRLDGLADSRLHVDVGTGLRLAQTGDSSQIRLDWGIGLRDGRMRLTAGYVTSWGRR